MMRTAALGIAVLLVSSAVVPAQQPAPAAPRSRIAASDLTATAIPGVVAAGAPVKVLKRDFEVAINGAIGVPDGSGVLVTEILRNRVWKFNNDDRGTIFLENTDGALCLGFDPSGRLIANQTVPASRNRLAIIDPKDRLAVIADNFEGRPFGRPNDLIVAADGGIYFTDPGPNEGQARAGHPKTEPAVYYISAPGTGRTEWGRAAKVIADVPDPNGLVLSPDGKILYVADTSNDYVSAFDVQTNGMLRNKRNFARLSEGAKAEPDGMTIDNAGRLYVSVWGGVEVFDAKGQRLGLIPGSGPGNLAFGGPEKKILYITGGTSLSKVPMIAQGVQSRKGK